MQAAVILAMQDAEHAAALRCIELEYVRWLTRAPVSEEVTLSCTVMQA